MIKLENASKSYQTKSIETLALQDISLEVERGEFISIMGPSGCGKSTLLNLMGLLARPGEGSIYIEGTKITSYKDREVAKLRNQKIGFVFQSYNLISDLNVVDNVEIPLLYRRCTGKERRRLALEALDKVGLSARTKHFPTELSGGQQQRVAIARAIVGKPKILLADEPTGNLDSAMGSEIMKILQELQSNENTTIVMVTHDEEKARLSQRIVRLFDGMLIH